MAGIWKYGGNDITGEIC